MPSETQVVDQLRSILRATDLNTATEDSLKEQLEAHFHSELVDFEDAIRSEIENFIAQQAKEAAMSKKRGSDSQENAAPQKQLKTGEHVTAMPASGTDFALSSDGLLRCAVKEFKGRTYVDVRVYWKKGNDVNPTKKGLMMHTSEWAQLAGGMPTLEAALKDGDTSVVVHMNDVRRATVSDFKKNELSVDIREWYQDDSGDMKPGQKGVSLSKDAFQALKLVAPAITAQLPSGATTDAAPPSASAPAAAPGNATTAGQGDVVVAADGTTLWKLGAGKYASAGSFKGTRNVGLREYYEKDGLRPGKKGINLSLEEFSVLAHSAQVISQAVETGNTDLDVSLSDNRKVRLSHFKNQLLLQVREYYEAGGEQKPGSKGLAMTVAQWQQLAAAIPDVQAGLSQ